MKLGDTILDNRPRSLARASGVWFATVLSIVFVLTQARGWHFGGAILTALAFWVPIGVLIDLWARSLPVTGSPGMRKKLNNRASSWMVIVGIAIALAWTVFRPDTHVASTGHWIGVVDALLDRIEVVLPGLARARSELRSAGRPDVAAYFGAYQAGVALLFMVSLVFWSRLVAVSSVEVVRTKAMLKIVTKAYPTEGTDHPYGRRFFYACAYCALFLSTVLVLSALWHLHVTGIDRSWDDVISGIGAFFPDILVVLVAAPTFLYGALAWRTALRIQRDLSSMKS